MLVVRLEEYSRVDLRLRLERGVMGENKCVIV
jgi:hypothetical protein